MISGKILRDAIISGANNINNQRSRVDELNVFPVPDGDTGTNMGMTVGASVRELEALDDSCTVGEASKTAASAMLRGARGNSGVITSLLFRGFSKALEGKKEATAADIVEALKKGVEGAYKDGRTFNGNINWSPNWNDLWSDGTNKHPWYGFDALQSGRADGGIRGRQKPQIN